MAKTELRDLLVIEDSFINKMLMSPVYLAAFPFLKQHASTIRARTSGCGSCGRRTATSKSADYTSIKQTLAAMPSDKHAKLLQLAKAKSIRMIYRNLSGKVIKLTINSQT